jgi:hypothetical protein
LAFENKALAFEKAVLAIAGKRSSGILKDSIWNSAWHLKTEFWHLKTEFLHLTENGIRAFEKGVLALENTVLAFENGVLSSNI